MILPRASPAQVTWQLWNGHWTGAVRNDEPRVVISCSRTGDWNVGKTLSTWRHRTWWDLPGLPSLIKNWSREWPGNEAKLVFHNTNKSHKSCVKSCDHVPLGLYEHIQVTIDLRFHCTFFEPMDTDFLCYLIRTDSRMTCNTKHAKAQVINCKASPLTTVHSRLFECNSSVWHHPGTSQQHNAPSPSY